MTSVMITVIASGVIATGVAATVAAWLIFAELPDRRADTAEDWPLPAARQVSPAGPGPGAGGTLDTWACAHLAGRWQDYVRSLRAFCGV